MALTHLVAPVEGIPALGDLVPDETLAGDEGTAPGEGGRAPGVVATRVGLAGILLAEGALDKEDEGQVSGEEDHHGGGECLSSAGRPEMLAGCVPGSN